MLPDEINTMEKIYVRSCGFLRDYTVTTIVCIISVLVFFGLSNEQVLQYSVSVNHPFELWRFITAMVIHYSVLHLLANISMLLLIGTALEYCLGSVRSSVIMVITGVSALIGFLIAASFGLTGPTVQFSAGASGMIYGAAVVTGLLWYYSVENVWMQYFIVICIIMTLGIQAWFLTQPNMLTPTGSPVSHSAHLVAGVVGLLIGMVYLQFGSYKKLPIEPDD